MSFVLVVFIDATCRDIMPGIDAGCWKISIDPCTRPIGDAGYEGIAANGTAETPERLDDGFSLNIPIPKIGLATGGVNR